MERNSRKPSIEVKFYKPSGGFGSVLNWFSKKNKDELPSSIKGSPLFELNSIDLDFLKDQLNSESIKRHKAAPKPKASGSRQNLFNIPIKQLDIKERNLIKSKTKQRSNEKCVGSCTSLAVTMKKKSYKLKKVCKIKTFRSVAESSSSTSTLKVDYKTSSKIIIPEATYNSILMTSIPPNIIDSNMENPVFVPVRSIRKKNSESIIPPEPNNYFAEEVIRDIEAKTKVIPVIVKKVEFLEDELSLMSKTTREIQNVSQQNFVNELNITTNQPSYSSTFNRSYPRKTKSHLASKKNKRVKGKRHKARGQSSSVSWVAPITSKSYKDLNFVFGPKACEFPSSASASPIQTCMHGTIPDITSSTSEQHDATNISYVQNDLNENTLESFGIGFAKILGGKDAMQILHQLHNNFPLLCNVKDLSSTGEIQNLLSLVEEPAPTECNRTIVVEKERLKEDVDDNMHSNTYSHLNILACENVECLSISKIHSDEEKNYNKLLRSNEEIPEPEIKPEAVYDNFHQTYLKKCEENAEKAPQNDTLKWLLNACENENEKAELSITIKLKDGDKCVKRTFECLTPKKLAQIENPDNGNVVGGSKAQPNNMRSILTSSYRVYNKYEEEELKFPSMESVIPILEFDSAGEGDVLCPTTKVNFKYLKNESINFVKQEEKFLLDGLYLDRKKRETFDEKIRSTTPYPKNINLLHPSTSLSHYMAYYNIMEDSMLERKNTNHNNFDCDNIYSDSEHTAPLDDYYLDKLSDIKYADKSNILDILKINRSSTFYTLIRDEDEKFEEDLKIEHNRYGLTLLEGIEEELEESEEEKVESVSDVKENKMELQASVSVQVVRDVRSVGSQTEGTNYNVEFANFHPCINTYLQQCNKCINAMPFEALPDFLESTIFVNGIEQIKDEENKLDLDSDKISAGFESQDPSLRISVPLQVYKPTEHMCSHSYFYSSSDDVVNSDVDIVRDAHLFCCY